MVKQEALDLKISCKSCGTTVDIIRNILANMKNQWDPNEPTGWVQQRLDGDDLGVLTHFPIYCTTCPEGEKRKKLGTVKIVFDSQHVDSELKW